MKELVRSEAVGPSDMYRFLIESDGELQTAIDKVIERDELGSRVSVRGVRDEPSVYPYVVCIYPDAEYYHVSLAFVALSDFFEDLNLCQQIRDLLINDETMRGQLERVNDAIKAQEAEVEFRDMDDEPNPSNQYCLNNAQADWLRIKGFKVSWEKYPRSWKVSGWF